MRFWFRFAALLYARCFVRVFVFVLLPRARLCVVYLCVCVCFCLYYIFCYYLISYCVLLLLLLLLSRMYFTAAVYHQSSNIVAPVKNGTVHVLGKKLNSEKKRTK